MEENSNNKKWSGKSRGGRSGHLFFVFAIRYFGIRFAYFVLSLVVVYFIPCAPKATSAIWDYYRNRLGYSRLKSALNLFIHYYRFGQTIIDKVAINRSTTGRYKFEFENYDEFLSLLNSGKGIIMIGAHVGCWETGSHFFGSYGRKINVVMYDSEYEHIKKAVGNNEELKNFKIIQTNKDPLDAIIQIRLALSSGEYVCFQGDRYLEGNSTLACKLLGHNALLPAGPFAITSKMNVPVVFYYAMRERPFTYRFHFKIVDEGAAADKQTLAEQYAASLETIIGRYPRQWFNFYKFWD